MLQHFFDYPNWERGDATLSFFWLLFCLLFLNNLDFPIILDSYNLQMDGVTLTCHWLESVCLLLITHLNGVNILSFQKKNKDFSDLSRFSGEIILDFRRVEWVFIPRSILIDSDHCKFSEIYYLFQLFRFSDEITLDFQIESVTLTWVGGWSGSRGAFLLFPSPRWGYHYYYYYCNYYYYYYSYSYFLTPVRGCGGHLQHLA